jgi:nicotinamidase/pyrazinamidase
MNKLETLFWDVHTQVDFMEPEGKLYVPHAMKIIPVVNSVRRFVFEHDFSLLASTDWHTRTDREISPEPDFKETYPEHCIAGSPGAERVGILGDRPIHEIPNRPVPENQLRAMVQSRPFHLVIRQSTVDVFTNPNTLPLLEILQPQNVVIFGVALDVCVLHTVEGIQRWGRSRITVLADAVKGLGSRPDAKILQEWQDRGIRIETFAEVKKELLDVAAK